MTKEDAKQRRFNWFRSKDNTEIQLKENNSKQEILAERAMTQAEGADTSESEKTGISNGKNLFSKDNQDKVVVDLITSIENVIQNRQLILYEKKGLDDQLRSANETISRIKQDIVKKDQVLQEKNKEIRELETSLTNKQMAYDQLLEDYREYQTASSMEYDKISNQLETETNKYKKLNEESIAIQQQNMLKINELEERIRNLEIENKQYIDQYQTIVNEKSELMETINDFTQRMSFSFTPKTNTSNSSNPE